MAAMLFNGALGNFNPLSVFGAAGGMGTGRRRQPSPATSYVPSAPHAGSSGGHVQADVSLPHRSYSGVAAQRDEIKRLPLSDEAMAAAAYGDPRYWTAQVGAPAPGTGASIAPGEQPSQPTQKQFSEQGINMLGRAEGGLRLQPYDDQTGRNIDRWVPGATIGVGHLIAQDQWTQFASGITEEQANYLFESDLQPFVDTVNASLIHEVTQSQFDALVVLCFNIGPAAFRQTSALRLVNDPQAETSYGSVDDAWRAWNRSQGQVNRGLENRRNAELDLYNHGNYGE
jgi:type VI secretion system secreted protein VgrG